MIGKLKLLIIVSLSCLFGVVLSSCSVNHYTTSTSTTTLDLATEPTSPGNLPLLHNWTRLQTIQYPPNNMSGGLMSDDPLNKGVLYFDGNESPDNYLTETWIFAKDAWIELKPKHTPINILFGVMAYDNAIHRVVLFGGGNNYTYSTWEWNGEDWVQIHSLEAPSYPIGASMTYDPFLGKILFYTYDSNAHLSSTWTFDGNTWDMISSEPNLPNFQMENNEDKDLVCGQILNGCELFVTLGGGPYIYSLVNNSWKLTNKNPIVVGGVGIIDCADDRLVAFNGLLVTGIAEVHEPTPGRTFFEFKGAGWVEVNELPAPPVRSPFSYAYDSTDKVGILYGGMELFSAQIQTSTWVFRCNG